MHRIIAFLLAAVMVMTLAACGSKAPETAEQPVSQAFTAPTAEPAAETPAPEIPAETPFEPAPEEAELPLVVDPGPGDFPGGLDDDGRGDDEYGIFGENDPRFEGVGIEGTETLTADAQYEANIFLSNFAEQGFRFTSYDLDMSQLLGGIVDFAHTWCKANDYGAIDYGQVDGRTCEILTADRLCRVTDRFFPLEISEAVIEEYYRPGEHSFYRDGCFYFDAADGEAYNRIAVAERITRLTNGLRIIDFAEYEIDPETYFSFEGGIPRLYYELTPETAAARPELTRLSDGSALAEPYSYNGRATYRLLEYTVFD